MQVFTVHALLLSVGRVRSTIESKVTKLARLWHSSDVFRLLLVNIGTFSIQVLLAGWALQFIEEILSSAICPPISIDTTLAVVTVPG